MLLDLVPNLLALPTVLLPIFASYRALKANDIAQLKPWLMFWVVLGAYTLVEGWLWWILAWVPFFAWFRLFFLLYLSLPQTQGARLIYTEYFHPYIETHERDIEDFIARTHEQAISAGLLYLKKAMRKIQELMGMPQQPETPPPPPSTSYAQSLFSRFSMPAVPAVVPSGAAQDFYGFLSHAVVSAATGSKSREAQVEDLTSSGSLIPPQMKTQDERMGFIRQQRERLQVVLSALDKEALNVGGLGGTSLPKNVSEGDFERVERDEIAAGIPQAAASPQPHAGQAGWIPWGWTKPTASQPGTPRKEISDPTPKARSSGVDL